MRREEFESHRWRYDEVTGGVPSGAIEHDDATVAPKLRGELC